MGVKLARLSRWVDESPENAARDPEAATWGRLSKITEEAGEVITAFIGATGQNPRKGFSATEADVRKELLDVAVAALAAYEHLSGNQGQSVVALKGYLDELIKRAGLSNG